MKIIELSTGKRAVKHQISVLFTRDDIIKRVMNQITMLGKPLPGTQKEIMDLLVEDTIGIMITRADRDDWDTAVHDRVCEIVNRLFPELHL